MIEGLDKFLTTKLIFG